MFTFSKCLSLNLLIPCQSLASAKRGSTHTLRLRKAFSSRSRTDSEWMPLYPFILISTTAVIAT